MTKENQTSETLFCEDKHLDYVKYRTEFIDGNGLTFDNAYRLAHLPLVAPDHPLVIPTKAGTSYLNGLHDQTYSIVIPIPIDILENSESYVQLLKKCRAASFASKISWDTYAQRTNKLHATICSNLSIGQPPNLRNSVKQEMKAIGPVQFKIKGLFSGNLNIGRLYLKVYPEQRNEVNMCHQIQQAFGYTPTDLYLVGLFNFVEELNAKEAADLFRILDFWWNRVIVKFSVEKVWLIKSRDDLVLDGGVHHKISLV